MWQWDGLGSFPKPCYAKARGREKCQLVQDEIRAEVEEDRQTKMVSIYQQDINNSKYQHTPKQSITFVRAGEKAYHKPRSSGLLTTAQDWKLQVDLGRQLKFPDHIFVTSLHPDMVLTSEAMKQVVLVEPMSPRGPNTLSW